MGGREGGTSMLLVCGSKILWRNCTISSLHKITQKKWGFTVMGKGFFIFLSFLIHTQAKNSQLSTRLLTTGQHDWATFSDKHKYCLPSAAHRSAAKSPDWSMKGVEVVQILLMEDRYCSMYPEPWPMTTKSITARHGTPPETPGISTGASLMSSSSGREKQSPIFPSNTTCKLQLKVEFAAETVFYFFCQDQLKPA